MTQEKGKGRKRKGEKGRGIDIENERKGNEEEKGGAERERSWLELNRMILVDILGKLKGKILDKSTLGAFSVPDPMLRYEEIGGVLSCHH